jgi:16S rRNA (guanine966-N2)-methyltransferase
VRIIGGAWRSRRIAFPDVPDLRPTPDRVRETLFNWLGQDLAGLSCLDLYAGSGALGFEAASRGATRVVMLEIHPATIEALEAARTRLGATSVDIRRLDAAEFLSRPGARFDVVFLDPPFRQNAILQALATLPAHLAAGARVYVEAARPVELPVCWRELRRARAGQVSVQLLEYLEDDRRGLPGNV